MAPQIVVSDHHPTAIQWWGFSFWQKNQYSEKYHSAINQNSTFLVRQLPPSKTGLPIEIYVFIKDKNWANYEALQADIFDHILAVVPEFDLRVYQSPTGADLRMLNTK